MTSDRRGRSLRRRNDFENAKAQCLGKRDKSFAGRIDPKAVEICAVVNERKDCYTTSSCAGRCFLYKGPGYKSSTKFRRFRISHGLVRDPDRYFDLTTIDTDPTGGGDPIRSIGQYDYKQSEGIGNDKSTSQNDDSLQADVASDGTLDNEENPDETIWLRYEPFILHVACRSLKSASALMAAARPSFKNVGLTTWKDDRTYLVAIWGDEGLEMPLCTPSSEVLLPAPYKDKDNHTFSMRQWLASLVNERHERNWKKIESFVRAVREMPPALESDEEGETDDQPTMPRSFDVIGDIAYLHSIPEGDEESQKAIGERVMAKNKAIKVVVVRESNMQGTERAPGSLRIIAGAQRCPLITTHQEYGVRCVVDLEKSFFSPRMGPERLRICQQVARGEHVLVVFAGVAMDALQIASRTEAVSVVAVELNEVAVECARRSLRMLERNKTLKCPGAAQRLTIIQGDVLEVVPSLFDVGGFERIVAPRPKEGALDGDLGSGDGGLEFLNVLLPRLRPDGGECHWYDFVADHEFPDCLRTRKMLSAACEKHGLDMTVIHTAKAGSVAMHQYRVCIDFKVAML